VYGGGGREIRLRGTQRKKAVNELNTVVVGYIYLIKLAERHAFEAYEELDEVLWISKANWQNYRWAHLASEFVLPKWLSGDFDQ